MKPRVAAFGLLTAMLVAHGALAWLSPLQGDDWEHWLGHGGWLATHFTFSDVAGYALARSTLVHAVVTPLAGVALVAGMFTVAARRLPRLDAWGDVMALALLSAVVWIATPQAALVWGHRPYVAVWIYGSAVALWFFAPYRCGWQPRGAWVPLLVVAGLCAGSASRQVGTVLVVGTLLVIRRMQPRPRWAWLGFAGLVAGTIAVYLDAPQLDFKGFRGGFEGSLGVVGLSLGEGGELITLLLGLALVKLVVAKLWPRHAGEQVPRTDETLRWLWAWFALTVLAMFGPKYSQAMLFPASLALGIAALPYLEWLATSRPVRGVLIALAVGVHVVVWTLSLAYYVPYHAIYRDRIAALEAAPAGGVAVVEPYPDVDKVFWAYGEDWAEASPRQLIAIELFGLRDVELATPIGTLERNPHLAFRFESDGGSPAPPAIWATNLPDARRQFERAVAPLAAGHARLVVDMPLGILRGRPLLAAAYDDGVLTSVETVRRPPEERGIVGITIKPRRFARLYKEAYAITPDGATRIIYDTIGYPVTVMTTQLHAVVACDPKRCFLVDAYLPSL